MVIGTASGTLHGTSPMLGIDLEQHLKPRFHAMMPFLQLVVPFGLLRLC